MKKTLKTAFMVLSLLPILHMGSGYAASSSDVAFRGGGGERGFSEERGGFQGGGERMSQERAEYPNAEGRNEGYRGDYNLRAGGAAYGAYRNAELNNANAAASESEPYYAPQSSPVQVNVSPSNAPGQNIPGSPYIPY